MCIWFSPFIFTPFYYLNPNSSLFEVTTPIGELSLDAFQSFFTSEIFSFVFCLIDFRSDNGIFSFFYLYPILPTLLTCF